MGSQVEQNSHRNVTQVFRRSRTIGGRISGETPEGMGREYEGGHKRDGVRKWRRVTQDRIQWRKLSEVESFHPGL